MLRRCVLCALFLYAYAQTAAQQQPLPTFRTGVDVVELDVTVLDKDRHPIKGLTAQDFTILERGKPQPIVAFSAVEIPAPISYPAAWMRDAPLDVVSNIQDGRLITIVMDDAYTGQSPAIMKRAKDVARAAIDQLGPRDLASVVFTLTGRMQNFTADRAELIRAVDSFAPKLGRNGGVPGSCDFKLRSCDIETIVTVANNLATAPPGRKILILVSGGRDFAFGRIGGSGLPSSATHVNEASGLIAAFNALQRGNVAVYAFGVEGLRSGGMSTGRGASTVGPFSLPVSDLSADDSLHSFAESTGGRAVTNTNDPAAQVTDVFRDSNMYYFVGFRSTAAPDEPQFRKIEVKLNRPGLTARTRNGYYSPASVSRPVDVMNGLPRGDLPLQTTAAAFAAPGRPTAEVLFAAGIDPAAGDLGGKTIDLTATMLDLDGKPCATQHASIALEPDAQLDLPVRLSVKPGRYLVQLSAQSAGRSGVVVMDVDVPDFSREPLSASGLILRRKRSPAVSDTAAADPVPYLPSTIRQFRMIDDVIAFLRIYQGGKESIAPVRVSATITDEKNVVKNESETVLESTNFSANRSADYQVSLPLEQLSTGQYLLQIEARTGDRRVQRTARFTVR